MNIAVNGYFLAKPKTGMGQYVIHVLDELLQDPQDDWSIYVPSGYDYEYLPEHIRKHVVVKFPGWLRKDLIQQVIWEKYCVPWFARKADVLWVPYQCLAWSDSVRTVMTVHDLIPWRMPEYIPNKKQAWYYDHLEDVLEHVPEIITVSEFSKQEIQSVLDRVTDAITVVPLASSKDPEIGVRDAIKHEKYVLYVGGLDKRKNVIRLVEAFADMAAEEPETHLYIPGNYFKNPLIPNIPAKIRQLGMKDRIHMLGYVSDEELVGLMKEAQVVAYPSEYEGFGFPILEAMSMGTPVITSSIGVMQEVAGEAAYTVDPYSVQSISRGLAKVLGDADLRAELSKRGLVRAQEFSWERTARETYAVLKG